MNSQTKMLMFQPELETLSRDRLRVLQLERLKACLAHAYRNVPHYQAAFAAAGVTPDSLRDLDDLQRFPFTVKDDLRRNYPFGLFAVPQDQILRIHGSSGTTGRPTVVGYSRGDLDRWADLMARTLVCLGARPGDIVHNAHGYGLFTGGLGVHYGAERLGCTVVPMSGGNTERQVVLLQDLGANVLVATPSYALRIAEVAGQMGVNLRDGPLRCGGFGAEPWSEAMRRELQASLGITAGDIYGLSEIQGPGVAAECHVAQAGPHIWEDHFLVEVIDPETLAPLPTGSTGELVITTLTKEALPMVRYRTRDITRLTDEPCACGRTHRRILRIAGRNDDMLIIRGVNVYPTQIESVLIGLPDLTPHYQLVIERSGRLDTMTVEVEAAPGTNLDPLYLSFQGRMIEHHIKSMIGVNCSAVVKSPGEVPRFEGKATRVRDLRK
ncbi:phenylacetate-CoA ligase [uncultured Gammaproteobacteria bacterium]